MSSKKHGSKDDSSNTRKRIIGKETPADKSTKNDTMYRNGLTGPQLEESLKKMDDEALLKSINYEREKLNDIAKRALEDDGNLDMESVREQNRVVESLINEALLRRLEAFDDQE